MKAISFENFSYAYPKSKVVLDKLCFDVKKGSFTAIVGPSGAGKTTLCMAAAGVVPHYFGGRSAGSVVVQGVRTMDSTMGELAKGVALVLEDYESQLVAMTVEEEVAFGLENACVDPKLISSMVQETLQLVGLAGREQQEVGGLSGGQKQRLALAGALVTKPEILILDEPASALDPEGAAELYGLLGRLNKQGMTIMVVEHEIARVLPHIDQLVLLLNGSIAVVDQPEAALRKMNAEGLFQEAIPPLLELRFLLEKSGCRFGTWRCEADAVRELSAALKEAEEVSQSA
ncbi:MAG: Polyamine-transporting ATPase [Firmicutes bacterium]|nr:Polyamine-transporting ATPase [Bacillota bacterium]